MILIICLGNIRLYGCSYGWDAIFGKLSDMFGRKRFFVFGLIVFLIGSALCRITQSMVQLSVFRAIQGIGGGALMLIAFTIVFDIFPP